MGQPSPEWIAKQRAAEAAMLERFAELDAVLIREEGRLRSLEARIAALRTLPSSDPGEREQEMADRRLLVSIAAFYQANPERFDGLQAAARYQLGGRPA